MRSFLERKAVPERDTKDICTRHLQGTRLSPRVVVTECLCRMGPRGCLILLLPTLRSGLCVFRQERGYSCQL